MHQLYFIGEFFQAKVKIWVFVKLDSRYADYFTEHSSHFLRALRLLNPMYGMTNSRKLFADELTGWLIGSVFIKYQCHMSIYYKYAPDEKKLMCYLILMIVSIGILMNILENGLWTL